MCEVAIFLWHQYCMNSIITLYIITDHFHKLLLKDLHKVSFVQINSASISRRVNIDSRPKTLVNARSFQIVKEEDGKGGSSQ